jgi:hypothetical protein
MDPTPPRPLEPSIHVSLSSATTFLDVISKVFLIVGMCLLLYWHDGGNHPTPGPQPPGPAPGPSPLPGPSPIPPGPAPDPDNPDSDPTAADGAQLGRDFAPQVAKALADGFEAFAADVEAKKTMVAADGDLKAVFNRNNNKAFNTAVAPAFAALVPAGTEPKDDETRTAIVRLARDFAKGLRGGR